MNYTARSSIQAESACALCPQQVHGNLSYPHLRGSGLTLTSKWHGFNPSAPLGFLRHLPLAKGMQRDQLTWCFVTQLHNTPQNAYLGNSNYSVFSKGTGTHPLKPPEWSWRAETLHWYRRSRSAVRHAPTQKAVWLNLFFKAKFNIKYRNLLRIILLNTHKKILLLRPSKGFSMKICRNTI